MNSDPPRHPRRIAGCMTGTSIDGVDAAVIRVEGRGTEIKVSVDKYASRVFPDDLADDLRALAEQRPARAAEIASLAHRLSQLHIEALGEICEAATQDFIVVHGQTIYHNPPLSWQLISPALIHARFRVPVLFDLRSADIAAGGQGAPITPIADHILFGDSSESRCVVNLGGFCNITFLNHGEIGGRDLCACNHVLNQLARRLFHVSYDHAGQIAASGRAQNEPFAALTSILEDQVALGRSLGTGDELDRWLGRYIDRYSPADMLRTAGRAIAAIIVHHCGNPQRLILSGGSTANETLVSEIRALAKCEVEFSDVFGVPAAHREAVCMAVLGALSADGVPITLSQVTGVQTPPLAGAWIGR